MHSISKLVPFVLLAAQLAYAQDQTPTTNTTAVTTNVPESTFWKDFEACVAKYQCGDDAQCRAKCLGSAGPTDEDLQYTENCRKSKCEPILENKRKANQTATEADLSEYSVCIDSCLKKHYLRPNGESNSGNDKESEQGSGRDADGNNGTSTSKKNSTKNNSTASSSNDGVRTAGYFFSVAVSWIVIGSVVAIGI